MDSIIADSWHFSNTVIRSTRFLASTHTNTLENTSFSNTVFPVQCRNQVPQ